MTIRSTLHQCIAYADTITNHSRNTCSPSHFNHSILSSPNRPKSFYWQCDRLRKAYAGDFLANLLHESPEEVSSWVRKPFTLYSDYFLQAVLYAAEYELRVGQQLAD